MPIVGGKTLPTIKEGAENSPQGIAIPKWVGKVQCLIFQRKEERK